MLPLDEIGVAREQARRLRPRALAEAARPLTVKWKKDLAKNCGDVPFELAAILAISAGGGNSNDPWPVGPAAAERFGIEDDTPSNIRLWAGLRQVNEVGVQLHQHYGPTWPVADADFWAAVIQARDIGVARWAAVLATVLQDDNEQEPSEVVAAWAMEADPGTMEAVAQAPPALVAYRLATARARVQAARVLAGGIRPLVSTGFGRPLERPDLRKRVTAARIAGGTHIVTTIGMVAYHLGTKFAPQILARLAG